MRLAVKSTVTLATLYLLIVIGLGFWMERRLRTATTSLMADTAQLIGTEIAAATSQSALDQLLQGDPATHQRLAQMVSELSKRSNVLASIAVVDGTGKVVVSDELETGHQLVNPAVIFQNTTQPQFLASQSPFHGGTYHLFVPLLRQDTVVGYLRLSLGSRHLADLYGQARRQVILAAAIGLSGIGALGFFFHVQLSRRGAVLARTLEATARGETVLPPARNDEFSQVLEAAGKVGRELSATRERSSQTQRRITALANFMDVGVLMLGTDWQLEFANAAARDLLGCCEPGDLETQWTTIQSIIESALKPRSQNRAGEARADIEVPGAPRQRRLRLELHCPGDDEPAGYLVLVKDRDFLEAFETDLRLATQMRGLARVYGALAHELKAPLGAMSINLELLNDALQSKAPDDQDVRARRQRYAEVLREELARLNRSLLSVLSQTTSLNEAQVPLDLRDLLRDLEALLAPQAKQQLVSLEVRYPQTPVPLVGHRDRLKQALLNIATNALDAMPHGGRMEISLAAEDGRATVVLRDTGPGMAPEVLHKIYNMHFTTKVGGTGIGLYVVRSVVESHGGNIQVESQPGQGTCFRVTFPLAAEEA